FIIDGCRLRHQEKGRTPPRSVHRIERSQKRVFPGRSDSTLYRKSYRVGFIKDRLILSLKGVVIGRKQSVNKFCLAIPEFFENRTKQVSVRRKGMATAIEARLNPELANPKPLLGKHSPLHEGRSEIGHLQAYPLLEGTGSICIELRSPRHIIKQPRVHSGRKHERRIAKITFGVTTKRCKRIGSVFDDASRYIAIILVHLGHDIHINASRHDLLTKPALKFLLLFALRQALHL